MGSVPSILTSRWASRELVGQAKHQLVVRVRRGMINRLYQSFYMLDGSTPPAMPSIHGGAHNSAPWQGEWQIEAGWVTLPNVESVKITKSTTSDNGSSTATIVMDNVAFTDTTGPGGLYRVFDRGYYSPQRGIPVAGRTTLWTENSWADVLNGGYELEVWEGYGPDGDPSVVPLAAPVSGTCVPASPAISRTFVGLIDGDAIDTHPDKITITCRDFGMLLTDQRAIYHNKAPEIASPITFADRTHTATPGDGWILVDDAADIVRIVLMWAGFHEFDIDNFGWSLQAPLTFGQDAFFIDIINAVAAQADWLFYMESPTDLDLSIGVPCFKQKRVFTTSPPIVATVTDQDMVEALTVNWDLSNLPYSIRIRGALDPSGFTFGADLAKRFMGVYFPPWSGIDWNRLDGTPGVFYHSERLAGNRRSYVQTQATTSSVGFNSNADCVFAAVLTAVQFALQAVTGSVQISGLPGCELNKAVDVVDESTGTNSRIWITSVESDHTLGPNGSWHMTITGSLLDTEDLDLIGWDFAYMQVAYAAGRLTAWGT